MVTRITLHQCYTGEVTRVSTGGHYSREIAGVTGVTVGVTGRMGIGGYRPGTGVMAAAVTAIRARGVEMDHAGGRPMGVCRSRG